MRELVGNVYPNKFSRSAVSGVADTITNILHFPPIVGIVSEIKEIVATLAERERPPAEIKDALNARLKEFGNVRISGRLTTPTRGTSAPSWNVRRGSFGRRPGIGPIPVCWPTICEASL